MYLEREKSLWSCWSKLNVCPPLQFTLWYCGCWLMVLFLLGPRVISPCSHLVISLGSLLSLVYLAGVIPFAIWFSPLACGFVSRVFLCDFTPQFYLYDLLFLHGLSLIFAFSLFTSHIVKWVSASFSTAYLMVFLSVSLCFFLSRLPHDFLSVISYGFFLCVGFYPCSDHEVTLQVWTVSYSTWLSEGISMIECLLC